MVTGEQVLFPAVAGGYIFIILPFTSFRAFVQGIPLGLFGVVALQHDELFAGSVSASKVII